MVEREQSLQLIKCLMHKYVDLSFSLQYVLKKLGKMVFACHPRTADSETGGSLGLNLEALDTYINKRHNDQTEYLYQ